MSCYLSKLLPAQAVDLSDKFDRDSWHVTARPLRLTHSTELLVIVEEVATRWPALTFLACVEQWGNKGHSYFPHLHLVAQTGDDDLLADVQQFLSSFGMDVHAVPIDGEEHAQYLLGKYFLKGEMPMFFWRQGFEFEEGVELKQKYGQTDLPLHLLDNPTYWYSGSYERMPNVPCATFYFNFRIECNSLFPRGP
jgi:hypothetical protein